MNRLLRACCFALVVFAFVSFGPMAMRGAWSLVPVKGAQVGCTGGCSFETSFLTTNKNYDGSATGVKPGWTADVNQTRSTGGVCATGVPGGFASQQAGVSDKGNWTDAAGRCDAVLTAANYASGAGGRGFRHYMDTGAAGNNSNGGGITIATASAITTGTFNVTWMERWDAGMNWNYLTNGPNPHYIKSIYMINGTFLICGYQGTGYGCNHNGGANTTGSTCTWVTTQGGANADGLWHNHEIQVDLTNARVRYWIDGVACLNTAYAMVGFGGFSSFFISNQAYVNVSGFTDYDDLKVEAGLTAGDRIGSPTEIGGGGSGGGTGSGVPATPTGLRLRVRVPGIGGFFGLQH